MRAVDIIIKKKDKEELTKEEIDFFVQGYAKGTIPDYQAAAWAMAVLLNGMTDLETTELTLSIANSGEQLDLSSVVPFAVDKHSTGGVGDKTTITVAPIVAACGLPVGKMSGRGLGFSGGTLDKLESIPGYRVDLSTQEFLDQLGKIGIVITGQSLDLAPADGKLYGLRDVTGTVQSIPLIASSVMSKKIAAGAQAILLDVKVGRGAFMRTLDEASELAELMVSIGKLSGRKVIAILSNMDEPLGCAVGNALELKEAVRALQGSGPADYLEHCHLLASYMLLLGGKVDSLESGKRLVEAVIANGKAYAKLRELVFSQGGDVSFIDEMEKLPSASQVVEVQSKLEGWIKVIDAKEVGEAAVMLGAGRAKKEDIIDPAVGILVHTKVGDYVKAGQVIFEVHVNDDSHLDEIVEKLTRALEFSESPVEKLPLFFKVIQG